MSQHALIIILCNFASSFPTQTTFAVVWIFFVYFSFFYRIIGEYLCFACFLFSPFLCHFFFFVLFISLFFHSYVYAQDLTFTVVFLHMSTRVGSCVCVWEFDTQARPIRHRWKWQISSKKIADTCLVRIPVRPPKFSILFTYFTRKINKINAGIIKLFIAVVNVSRGVCVCMCQYLFYYVCMVISYFSCVLLVKWQYIRKKYFPKVIDFPFSLLLDFSSLEILFPFFCAVPMHVR